MQTPVSKPIPENVLTWFALPAEERSTCLAVDGSGTRVPPREIMTWFAEYFSDQKGELAIACFRIANRFFRGDFASAEDMVQDAMIRAMRSLHTCQGGLGKLVPWCKQVVRNRCLDALRAETRKPTSTLEFTSPEGERVPLELPDRSQAPPSKRLDIERFREALSAAELEVFDPFYVLGCSGPEVAEELGIKTNAVHQRLSMIRKRAATFFAPVGARVETSPRSQGGNR